MIDIHCHILPELDDGAEDLEAALAMARIAVRDGVREIVATPHVFDGRYEVARAAAEEKIAVLRAALERESIPLGLHLGSDCHLDERIFDPAHAASAIGIAGGKYILVELPHEIVPPRVEDAFFRLRAAGRVPILTHPERNAELERPRGIERIEAWVASGLLVQVTAASLEGEWGPAARAAAETLVERGLCHFVATDAHAPDWRPPRLSGGRAAVERLAGPEVAQRLVEENPRRAIRGERIEAAGRARAPVSKKASLWR